ncbi:MAG: TIGR04086 family membrane protein [Oscillospiraceae bacterium]|nr:TIGR04086 family membrane protein [Oscillospiraceae bacterium]
MRKRKREPRLMPYAAGMVVGYIGALAVSMLAAGVLSLTDAAAKTAGSAAVVALIIGSFLSGRTAGVIKRRDGLKTGALCGLAFVLPLLVISAVFSNSWSVMFIVKLLLCTAFAAVGGVAGVNKDERL